MSIDNDDDDNCAYGCVYVCVYVTSFQLSNKSIYRLQMSMPFI